MMVMRECHDAKLALPVTSSSLHHHLPTSPSGPYGSGFRTPQGSHSDTGDVLFDSLLVDWEKFLKAPSHTHCTLAFDLCKVRSNKDWVTHLKSEASVAPALFTDHVPFTASPLVETARFILTILTVSNTAYSTVPSNHNSTTQSDWMEYLPPCGPYLR